MILSPKNILPIFFLSIMFPLSAVDFQPKSMAYVLQAENLGSRQEAVAKLADSGRDLVVIDYAYDGSKDGKWTKEEIAKIRAGKKGRKVIAYISIGEAEDYRAYWKKEWDIDKDGKPDKGAPTFLNTVNPDWAGNYKVKYWDTKWQEIIHNYIAEIIAQSFDGIYLDIVDAFEFYEKCPKSGLHIDHKTMPGSLKTYRDEMFDFVVKIGLRSRMIKEDFIIIPQNGSQLLERKWFIREIDGFAVEDLFTDGNKKQDNEHTKYVLGFLKKVKEAGKPVLVIEYGTKEKAQKISRSGAKKGGLVLLITDRELKTLGRK